MNIESTYKNLKQIIEAIENNTIYDVCINEEEINSPNEDWQKIANALKVNETITEFSFPNANLEPYTFFILLKGLKECKVERVSADLFNIPLLHLDLRGNFLKDEGAEALAEVLKYHDLATSYINLSHNQIGDTGIIAITEALRFNENVAQYIDVSFNLISDKGEKVILDSGRTVILNGYIYHSGYKLPRSRWFYNEKATQIQMYVNNGISVEHLEDVFNKLK